MAVLMSDVGLTVFVHSHHCPLCGEPFSCPAPFCEKVVQMACDDCFGLPTEPEPPRVNYDAIRDYLREREASRS